MAETVTCFTYGSGKYMAVGGLEPVVYLLNEDYSLETVLTLEEAVSSWLAVPLDTYRGDVLLMAQKSDNITVYVGSGFYKFIEIGDVGELCSKSSGEL